MFLQTGGVLNDFFGLIDKLAVVNLVLIDGFFDGRQSVVVDLWIDRVVAAVHVRNVVSAVGAVVRTALAVTALKA